MIPDCEQCKKAAVVILDGSDLCGDCFREWSAGGYARANARVHLSFVELVNTLLELERTFDAQKPAAILAALHAMRGALGRHGELLERYLRYLGEIGAESKNSKACGA